MHIELLTAPSIHVDETVLPLQDIGKTLSARAWTYLSPNAKITLYQFTTDKRGAHVRDFLKHPDGRPWNGYLQADAASNYDALFRERPGVHEVACWAHARRGFFDIVKAAQQVHPPTSTPIAVEMLKQINALFALEREVADQAEELALDPAMRDQLLRETRSTKAGPALAQLFEFASSKLIELLPKSPTAKSLSYVLNNATALSRYLEQPYLAIDNNSAERALRKIALGRKNWLFAGSERAGVAACTIMSLLETAKAHRVNPQTWLEHALRQLPTRTTKTPLTDLLPQNYKPAQ